MCWQASWHSQRHHFVRSVRNTTENTRVSQRLVQQRNSIIAYGIFNSFTSHNAFVLLLLRLHWLGSIQLCDSEQSHPNMHWCRLSDNNQQKWNRWGKFRRLLAVVWNSMTLQTDRRARPTSITSYRAFLTTHQTCEFGRSFSTSNSPGNGDEHRCIVVWSHTFIKTFQEICAFWIKHCNAVGTIIQTLWRRFLTMNKSTVLNMNPLSTDCKRRKCSIPGLPLHRWCCPYLAAMKQQTST